jgi:S-methylmethionine-dependent homocysteine/selenocysteine methylase
MPDADRYAALAAAWTAAGATILGGCCGTAPAHIRALAARFGI